MAGAAGEQGRRKRASQAQQALTPFCKHSAAAPAAGIELIYATDLQTRLAVARLHDIISATWGLLGGEGLFVPLITAYLFWCGPGEQGW